MNVRMFRQYLRIDLHNWAEDNEVPFTTFRCHLIQQLTVKTLINHAKKSETRMRNTSLIFRIGCSRSCFAKMSRINAARKCVDRRMLATLRFVQTPATRKNKIYLPEELFLQHWQLRIGAFESRQFVHAVINRRDWSELIREFERHRGVVPK